MRITAAIAAVVAATLPAASALAREPFPSHLDYLDADALKAWYDTELNWLDREIRAIGRIESRTGWTVTGDS
jgi:hypothetical protein